jgi:carbonic anhydrase/acetyltransferase-like protein (isoleucine patch superfamily)
MNPRRLSFGGAEPVVAAGTFVADDATLVGDVRIASGASVWFGAVLRADGDSISVGGDSNVQDGCILHADPGFPVSIGERVSIGHRAVVHGATVESDVLIGMGATLLNGSRIGGFSVVAAGAVVREGETIPPGSLVAGVPARVVRSVTEPARAHIERNAQAYGRLARAYAQPGRS